MNKMWLGWFDIGGHFHNYQPLLLLEIKEVNRKINGANYYDCYSIEDNPVPFNIRHLFEIGETK